MQSDCVKPCRAPCRAMPKPCPTVSGPQSNCFKPCPTLSGAMPDRSQTVSNRVSNPVKPCQTVCGSVPNRVKPGHIKYVSLQIRVIDFRNPCRIKSCLRSHFANRAAFLPQPDKRERVESYRANLLGKQTMPDRVFFRFPHTVPYRTLRFVFLSLAPTRCY